MTNNGSGVNDLPKVGRIMGLTYNKSEHPKTSGIRLQYTDPEGTWHQIDMPFLDGMYLLNLLKAAQIETGYPMPESPFAPKTKKPT